MARAAIIVMIPIVALLVWRDCVLERQVRLLALYDAGVQYPAEAMRVAARDEMIDEAMWDFMRGDAARALDRLDEATRVQAPTEPPQRAWLLAAAASCVLGQDPGRYRYWREDWRVRPYCKK